MQATVSPPTTSSGEYETMNTDNSANRPTLVRRWRWLSRTQLLTIVASVWFIGLAWEPTLTNPSKEKMLSPCRFLVLSLSIFPITTIHLLLVRGFERLRWTLFFMILQVVACTAFSINVNFHISWRESSDLSFASAGLSPLDPNLTSIVSSVEKHFTP
jgi:hypothetical protein